MIVNQFIQYHTVREREEERERAKNNNYYF